MFEKWCSSHHYYDFFSDFLPPIFATWMDWLLYFLPKPPVCKSWLTNLCFGSLDSEMLHVMGKRYLGVRRTYILRCAIVPLIFSDILGTIWHYHELIFGLTNAKSPMKRSTGFWDDRRELGLEHRWMYLAHLPSSRHSAPILRKM